MKRLHDTTGRKMLARLCVEELGKRWVAIRGVKEAKRD